MPEWSAEQYEKFLKQRTLPSLDLVNAIPCKNPERIIDIGCGTGNSTEILKNRFPYAEIIGLDSSANMLVTAREKFPDIEFICLDAGKELDKLTGKFDIVFSNACIQWIPEHEKLLKNLMGLLNENGVLAVQVPRQDKHPFHKIINDITGSEKWFDRLERRDLNILSDGEYFDILSGLSDDFRMWETVYFHPMPSHQSIVEWYKGTALRPYMEQLEEQDRIDFENDILCETKKIYPVQKNCEIIFRFPRLFFTVVKRGDVF